MKKILIICGPTATGKTSLALDIAKKCTGELISADSRQVYVGMDIVTGKDIPHGATSELSDLIWNGRRLRYYRLGSVKIWLYDVVAPDEPFNVSFWKSCADLIITDILSRGKLPIFVGGTGLYLKSITHPLSKISVPPNPQLRARLTGYSTNDLFNYLARLDPFASANSNQSDRYNPRRLVRAIELSLASQLPSKHHASPPSFQFLQVGLTAPKDHLYRMIDQRVEDRLAQGARAEVQNLLATYSPSLPSLTASGYRAFLSADPVGSWKTSEHQYARRQLTWFNKQPNIVWFDITRPNWKTKALVHIDTWYNN